MNKQVLELAKDLLWNLSFNDGETRTLIELRQVAIQEAMEIIHERKVPCSQSILEVEAGTLVFMGVFIVIILGILWFIGNFSMAGLY